MLKNKSIVFLLFLVLLFPAVAFADGIVPCGNSGQSACTLCHLIVGIWNLISWGKNILLVAAITAIFISGIMYAISAGSQMMETAKKFLTASITGFVIVLCAWLLVATVMWMLSAKADLGIGIAGANWAGTSITFTCDSQSSAGSGGGGNGTSTLNVNGSGTGGGGQFNGNGGSGGW